MPAISRTRLHVVFSAAVVLLAASAARAEAPPEGFTPLFNGRDMAGWQGKVEGYEVVDGVMHCKPGARGSVFTTAEYDDFVLQFDFKLTPGANNGLGIRMPPNGKAAYTGMELQILDDSHPKYRSLDPWQVHGSIYGVVPAQRGCLKPAGEWNTEEVTVQGSRVKVVVNGKTIVDADVAEFRDGKKPTADGKAHPGLSRAKGHIGFLGHGDEVFFRNIVVKPAADTAPPRWNILFVFADDWGRYASCYAGIDGRPGLNDVVATPAMDQLAREGVLFRNAFVSSPSCTPCRSALLSGRHFFRCGRGSILRNAIWDDAIPSFPLLVEEAGYRIGKSYKVWNPGHPEDAPFGGQRRAFERAGRQPNKFSEFATQMVAEGRSVAEAREAIVAQVRDNFRSFLAEGGDAPWLFFCGPTNTHRAWVKGSGKALWGIDPDALRGRLPAFLPDVPEVREDVADYLGEVQAVDAYVAALVAEVKAAGMLERTLIVASGDHGMPGVPQGKCELKDHGTAVALVARVPGGTPGRVVDDLVSLPDLAPTFLEVGGVPRPEGMTGQSLLPQLRSAESGQIDPARTFVITGIERHVDVARDGNLPYPMRALRTADHLYIRNFAPDRLPLGRPGIAAAGAAADASVLEHDTLAAYPDMDAGPTKSWLVRHGMEPEWRWLFDHSFAVRPAEELYDLRNDPDQLQNLAADPAHEPIRRELAARLVALLREAGDPRLDPDVPFERPPYTDVEKRERRGPLPAPSAAASTKPNILYLLADDLGYADIGANGCVDVPTPNIDSIAKNGVRFTNGYVSAPVCSPSRAGLITGRYQTRFGHEFNHPLVDQAPTGMPVDQKTMANWFKDAGYATAHIGKWHLGNPKLPQYTATARGFDVDLWAPGMNKLPPLTLFRNGQVEKADDRYVDLALAREAAGSIEAHKSSPWFLYVAFLSPHEPLATPAESEEPFAAIADPKRRKCATMISLLDESVGRVLRALRDSGQEERTLVIFHSDNGAPRSNASRNTPLRGTKGTMWEGGIREPFVMQWKGMLPAGRVVDAPVIALDILPTALAAAQYKVPADATLDGVNLLPYLTGTTNEPPRRNLFWRYGEQTAIRQGDWKLVTALDQAAKPPVLTTGLYDLAHDPAEAHELSAKHPDKVKELRALWDEWNEHNVPALWTKDSKDAAPAVGGGKSPPG